MKDLLSLDYRSYDFNIVDEFLQISHPLIQSIGHEKHTKQDEKPYRWDCNISYRPWNLCIFQCTLADRGMVQINDRKIQQNPGDIFLVERPGPYSYWLPEDSESWDLIYISFFASAFPFWNPIVQNFGRTIKMDGSSPVLKLWGSIFKSVLHNAVLSSYDNSILAYTFLMELHKYLVYNGGNPKKQIAVKTCINYINENYAKDISVVDIAEQCDISPFHLNKVFREIAGDTPLHYLIKRRITASLSMLYTTDLSIEEIAVACGFHNANYFAKVFRKYTGKSPTEFRKSDNSPIIL